MHLVQDLGQTYGTARGASRAPLVRGSVRCRRGRQAQGNIHLVKVRSHMLHCFNAMFRSRRDVSMCTGRRVIGGPFAGRRPKALASLPSHGRLRGKQGPDSAYCTSIGSCRPHLPDAYKSAVSPLHGTAPESLPNRRTRSARVFGQARTSQRAPSAYRHDAMSSSPRPGDHAAPRLDR
jgi:hypothetical protein